MVRLRRSSRRAAFQRFAFLLPGKMQADARKLKEDARNACTVRSKRLLERAAPDKGKEGSWREDTNWGFLRCHKKVLVPGDENLDAGGEGSCQDSLVVRISQRNRAGGICIRNP